MQQGAVKEAECAVPLFPLENRNGGKISLCILLKQASFGLVYSMLPRSLSVPCREVSTEALEVFFNGLMTGVEHK